MSRSYRTVVVLGAVLALAISRSSVRGDDSAILAVVDNTAITEADVRRVVQGKLIGLEAQIYDAKKEGLDAVITARLLQREATKQHLTIEALLEKEVASQVTDATPEEIESLYEQNKERLGKPLAEVRDAIAENLRTSKIEAVRDLYLEQLRAKAKVSIVLKPPLVLVPGGGPSRGPANAPVTIVEFSDFQCPFCGRAEQAVTQVLDAYKDKVRLVYRDYPLAFHPFAQKAAEAAHCAGDQGQYWEYHATLFKNQGALEPSNLEKYASDLKLDKKKFKECLDTSKHAEAVQQDVETGNSVGVNGTPAFFINGRFLSGAQPFEQFKEIIDQILKEKGAAS